MLRYLIVGTFLKAFASSIVCWQQSHGRNHLPWQAPYDRYRVWVSEIMLQQTQVTTVIPYFLKFIQTFPDVHTLAASDLDTVLAHWQGLGYYRRARYLWQAAKMAVEKYHALPGHYDQLIQLPGIGQSTAHAILSLSDEQPLPILDANVKRVLIRIHGITEHLHTQTHMRKLWDIAYQLMPTTKCRSYNQGLMDLGASLCTAKHPNCTPCPVKHLCIAHKKNITTICPSPKPKRKKPTREKYFLHLYTATHTWLYQRDNQSVWPSLWSLPEFECEQNVFDHMREDAPVTMNHREALEHTFSHYQLIMHVLHIHLDQPLQDPLGDYLPGHWIAHDALAQYALPRPISLIVNHSNTMQAMI